MKFFDRLLGAGVLIVIGLMVANLGIGKNFQPVNSPSAIAIPVNWPLLGIGALGICLILLIGLLASRK